MLDIDKNHFLPNNYYGKCLVLIQYDKWNQIHRILIKILILRSSMINILWKCYTHDLLISICFLFCIQYWIHFILYLLSKICFNLFIILKLEIYQCRWLRTHIYLDQSITFDLMYHVPTDISVADRLCQYDHQCTEDLQSSQEATYLGNW